MGSHSGGHPMSEQIKVGYKTLDGHDSKAYIDSETGVGTDKHSDRDIIVGWDGNRWVELTDPNLSLYYLPAIPDLATMADWNNPIAQRAAFNRWVEDFNAALTAQARAAYDQGRKEMSDAKSVNDAHKAQEVIPQDILLVLFRGLVHCGEQITQDQRERAWGWLEEHNHYEEMGQ